MCACMHAKPHAHDENAVIPFECVFGKAYTWHWH